MTSVRTRLDPPLSSAPSAAVSCRPAGARRYFLKPGIHAVMVDTDLVILDAMADEYMCVPDVAGLTFDAREVRGPVELLHTLVDEDLLASELRSLPYPTRPIPPLPTRACRPESSVPIAVGSATAFAGTWLQIAGQRPEIIELALRYGRRSGVMDDTARLIHRVDAFRRLSPVMPSMGQCLFQSWMLLAFLEKAGLDAIWVFGVRLRPFAAHCWLQTGDLALTDAPETLLAYRPILAI